MYSLKRQKFFQIKLFHYCGCKSRLTGWQLWLAVQSAVICVDSRFPALCRSLTEITLSACSITNPTEVLNTPTLFEQISNIEVRKIRQHF